MGEQRVSMVTDQKQMQHFVKNLLQDVQALEYMLDNDWFEDDITRIGAEQEMCLVDKAFKPAVNAMEILEKMKKHDWVETELAKFNLECNLTPRVFEGSCLSDMETEIKGYLNKIRKKANELDTDILLTGILPTLRKSDLGYDNLTPKKRYKALMTSLRNMRGTDYDLRIEGIDELLIKHDSPLLEACNTSFQVHLQVAPKEFANLYNIAQAITAPVMALAANSPLLFNKRLWHESRIALFQQSIDTRNSYNHLRDRSPRVMFGNDWLKDSIMEIYKEDIMRFRVLIASDVQENALDEIKNGRVPRLRALNVHNSTVYRWNRPCFGISDNGKPHLRIENRVFAAGPTVMDEMANMTFWLGLMAELPHVYKDISKEMAFEDARDNFLKAAKFGIDSKFTWIGDKKISAVDLILNELLPIARAGLKRQKIDKADIDYYLGIIEERAKCHTNGARWMLRTYTKFAKETTKDEAISALTNAMTQNQISGKPIHEWEIPELEDYMDYEVGEVTVEEFMETDIFTVQQDDIIELVADIMNWRDLRYIAVEDDDGLLTGLVSSTNLLKRIVKKPINEKEGNILVRDIMIDNPITISPTASFMDGMKLIKEHNIGCLPVVRETGELIGMITEMTFFKMAKRLLKK
ncbi:MAG: CBS domain-containing protein [Cognaticolwellia sp.]|jgi:CBS domain-containing protein